MIGIVFPVYYGELPVIIKEFAGKLVYLKDKYLFAVCTFGGSAGYSLKYLKKIILSRGGLLSATFQVICPKTLFIKAGENHTRLYQSWQKNLGSVIHRVDLKLKGDFFKAYFPCPFFYAYGLHH